MMRVGGAHLHLCLDGGESPVSVHLSADTGADQPNSGVNQTHHDQDLSLSGEVLSKKADVAFDLAVLLVAAFVLFWMPLVSRPVLPRGQTTLIPPPSLFRIRPPLRAPPV